MRRVEEEKMNIYDHGHFEGTKFVLDKPITDPEGHQFHVIDFTYVLSDVTGEENSGILEEIIGKFLEENWEDARRLDEDSDEGREVRAMLDAKMN